ncbi:MAG: hypothetical protein AAB074_17130 [Planctomycetota bacterium]
MRPRFAIVLSLALLAAGCGKGESTKNPGNPPAPPPAVPGVPKVPAASPLDILASANGSVECTAPADGPVVVQVDIFLKRSAGDSLTLTNPSGPWSEAFTLECRGPGDADKASLFSAASTTKGSIELTRARSGTLAWILDGAGASVLPAGTWTLRVVVDAKKLGNAVPDGLASSPVTLTVVAPAAASTPVAAQRRCLAVMNAAGWKKDTARALAAADAYLAKEPEDVAVLFLKGQVLRSTGKKVEALAAFEAALGAANRNKNPLAENFAIERAVADLRREVDGK